MEQISLEILTPEKVFFSGNVEWINVNLQKNKEQILPNHVSFAGGILPSVLKIKQEGKVKDAVITEGFLEFTNNRALLVVTSAEWPEDIDINRAKAAIDRAKKKLKDGSTDIKRAKMAILRASARIKAAGISGKRLK